MRCAKKYFFILLMTATSGWPTPEMRFLPEQLRWTLLPKERYGNSLSGRGSNTQASNWEVDTTSELPPPQRNLRRQCL